MHYPAAAVAFGSCALLTLLAAVASGPSWLGWRILGTTTLPTLAAATAASPAALPSAQTAAAVLPTAAPLPADEPLPDSPDRVADARRRFGNTVRDAFLAAGVPYPPHAIFLRAFKHERQLELWAQPAARAPYRLVRTFPILRASGRLGPKRRQGDWQVPEGFYHVVTFNPRSNFHLSLGLDYPNASDRLLATDPARPGSEIFIHGGAASVGCLALGDPAAAQLYLSALDARDQGGQRSLPVHLFPCRLDPASWETVLLPRAAAHPELLAFWRALQPGYDAFEREKMPPVVKIKPDGAYAFDSH